VKNEGGERPCVYRGKRERELANNRDVVGCRATKERGPRQKPLHGEREENSKKKKGDNLELG